MEKSKIILKYNHTNNKWYYQIDLDNFFQIDINPAHINFDYFDIFSDALKKIENYLPNKQTNKKKKKTKEYLYF